MRSAPARATSYGPLDRMLHHFALSEGFHGVPLQRALSDVEDSLLGGAGDGLPPADPVFIAGLPRSGTTLLLTLLAQAPEFATHTYRDMPFVLCPWLWQQLSLRFRAPARPRQRAHGDGLAIDYDSPEAFEEIIWLAFWRQHYQADRILPWSADERDGEFEAFFARHMRKLIAVRAAEQPGGRPWRYLSKNNANIARLALLLAVFPDCRIVVPLREPRSHAESLLRQHLRFADLHRRDDFARRYMAWLGHFEFGAGLRPIQFPGREGDIRDLGEPDTLDYWLRYWTAAHEAIAAASDHRILLLDHSTLRANPVATLAELASALKLRIGDGVTDWAARVRAPAERPPEDRAPVGAVKLYAALRERSLGAGQALAAD